MVEADFEVTLTGRSTGSVPADQARAALARLFKLTDDRVSALLAEAPVVIKRGLDEATAGKYRAALEQAGWEARLGAPPGVAAATPPALEATIAPTGSLMAEPRDDPPLDVDLSGLTLAEPGAQIGERREVAPPALDLSGLTLAEPGARLDEDPS
jgi:hypothetical protein